MNYVWSKSQNLKYKTFIQAGCKDMGFENLSLWQRLKSFDCNPGAPQPSAISTFNCEHIFYAI